MRFFVLTVPTIIIAMACGGTVATGPAEPDGGASRIGVPPPGSGRRAASSCPEELPVSGEACTREGLACEYGGEEDPRCNDERTCTNGRWTTTRAGACAGTVPVATCRAVLGPPSGLPAQCTPEAMGACTIVEDNTYVRCACERGTDAIARHQCLLGLLDAECASPRPRVGDGCAREGFTCDYGSCWEVGGGVRLRCVRGTWVREAPVCDR
ncbi:MAG: hypothetical protein IPG50_28310 [Myxococcales bacterium]|nr:hypothetical protein [Myxococcales bacterium]